MGPHIIPSALTKKSLSLVASAPPLTKHLGNGSDTETITRSNSCIENKNKYVLTSERLNELRKLVEVAVKQHKVFTIKGNWPVIRRELLKRDWIEKYEPICNNKQKLILLNNSGEDLTSNLPSKQDWESPTIYAEKCEKMIMSRMLQNYDVDLYWSLRKDHCDTLHRSSSYKLMNRFNRSLFASKEGLALLLQQFYWYTEPGVAFVNFPRCFVLGFPDHFNNFIDNYRLTACIGLIKWFINKYDTENKCSIKASDGRVPFTALKFALDRCTEYIESQKHLDIDKDYIRIWDHEWEQFLTNYYLILYEKALFLDSKNFCTTTLYSLAHNILLEMQRYWPEMDLDGMRNIWILKPGNKCRGRGIQLVKNINDVEKTMNLNMKYVVQKYIEKPLLIYNTKFDIRQWFLVASTQPLVIWMYRECYLRFSSQIFNLDNFHESLHLTNYAVQCKYTNMEERDKELPHDNMWDCHTFQTYLKKIGKSDKWDEVVFPGLRQSIVCAMLASQEVMDRRQNTFELYGADFMLSEDFRPWLIEINCSPDLSSSTSVTKKMCPQCQEDLIKVVIDRKRDPNASTGLFDLIYKQSFARAPPYLGMNLSIRGRKIFRNKNKNKQKEKTNSKEKEIDRQNYLEKRQEFIKSELIRSTKSFKNLKKLPSTPDFYHGPVIEDLIVDIQRNLNNNDDNNETKMIFKQKTCTMKKKNDLSKIDRVSKKIDLNDFGKNKFIKKNSICRKQNVKENCKKILDEDIEKIKKNKYNFGLFNEWALKNNISSDNLTQEELKDDVVWEKETVSILKGKNILNKYNADNNCEIYVNKQFVNDSSSYTNLFESNISLNWNDRSKEDENKLCCNSNEAIN